MPDGILKYAPAVVGTRASLLAARAMSEVRIVHTARLRALGKAVAGAHGRSTLHAHTAWLLEHQAESGAFVAARKCAGSAKISPGRTCSSSAGARMLAKRTHRDGRSGLRASEPETVRCLDDALLQAPPTLVRPAALAPCISGQACVLQEAQHASSRHRALQLAATRGAVPESRLSAAKYGPAGRRRRRLLQVLQVHPSPCVTARCTSARTAPGAAIWLHPPSVLPAVAHQQSRGSVQHLARAVGAPIVLAPKASAPRMATPDCVSVRLAAMSTRRFRRAGWCPCTAGGHRWLAPRPPSSPDLSRARRACSFTCGTAGETAPSRASAWRMCLRCS
jgi:hypothetical protein